MKYFVRTFFIIACGGLTVFSQVPANYNADNESFGMQPLLQFAFQQANSRNISKEKEIDIKGSPFLNRAFVIGSIYSSSGLEGKAYMRYNAYADEIQLKSSDNDSISLILNKQKGIYCVLGGKEMHYMSFEDKKGQVAPGYMFKIAETDSLLLFERIIKYFKEGKEPTNSFELPVENRFVGDRELYVQKKIGENVPKYLKPTKNNIVELFSYDTNKAQKVKKFISKSSLNFRDPKSMAQVFYYYNTL